MVLARFVHTYEEVISAENLLEAWREFVKGKRNRADAQYFERHLMSNILSLHERLADGTYRHSGYEAFAVSDPKPRSIHKAAVADRVLHRAVHRKLYPFFDRTFIADSFSCRVGKGTHKALDRFRALARKVSRNHTRTCWVLKCDIRKFFASIDHPTLFGILARRIADRKILALLAEIIRSFSAGRPRVGLPLGNLTSQLFANIYMNEFDRFVKHRLKARCYIRFADDFVILSRDRPLLEALIPRIRVFLRDSLKLELHPRKVVIETVASGTDFLGWIHFADHRIIRTATRRRMVRRLAERAGRETIAACLGLLGHGNTQGLKREIILAHAPQKVGHPEI